MANFAQVLCSLSERAYADDVVGSDMNILRKMVQQESEAIPSPGEGQGECSFQERCAGQIIVRHLWRKRYVANLREGIIPGSISCDFKPGVMATREGQLKTALTLLNVVDMVWTGFTSMQADHRRKSVEHDQRRSKRNSWFQAQLEQIETKKRDTAFDSVAATKAECNNNMVPPESHNSVMPLKSDDSGTPAPLLSIPPTLTDRNGVCSIDSGDCGQLSDRVTLPPLTNALVLPATQLSK